DNLDERIQRIAKNKQELLVVLENPEVPLHNNAAELGARVQVRKRDVSLHTITAEGTKAQDVFLTIVQTAKKLGVNPIAYFHDRFIQCNAIVRLAVLILKMAGVPPPPVPIC
ncbi:MAG: transposase, partial [Methanoregula sp.]|nr:transposase [Methanoregula sp.]